jgi:RNA polymerase sigma-70 factor (ECF subfamily)
MRAELAGPVDIDVVERNQRVHSRRAALDDLATRCSRRGYRIAYDLLNNANDAEDALQEALARACDGYGRVRDPDVLDAWFFRVLTNVCLKVLRRRRVGRALSALWPGERVDCDDAIPDPEPAADESIARARRTRRLLRAIETLPAMQKAAVVLRYGHELSVEETAEMLGVGHGTAKTHLSRALRRLRAELEETR